MNCFERNKQYLKLYPGFNGKPMQITKKSRHLFLSQTKHSEKNTSTYISVPLVPFVSSVGRDGRFMKCIELYSVAGVVLILLCGTHSWKTIRTELDL